MVCYVASAFCDYARARAAMAFLREHGATISLDWTRDAEQSPNDAGPPDARRKIAEDDMAAVRAADVVLVLTPDSSAVGCAMWLEAGMAFAFGKRVVFTGKQFTRPVFSELAEARFPTDGSALIYLTQGLRRS